MKNTDSRKWRPDDPRRLRMAEKRAEILRAARPILLRDGLGGTTLDRVAAEGKISKMTLYRHFPSKEALFEGLVTAMCEYMREGLENAPAIFWPSRGMTIAILLNEGLGVIHLDQELGCAARTRYRA